MLRQALVAAIAVFAAVAGLRLAGSLERMELAAYDAGLRARPQAPVDQRLVFVDETEEDLNRFGHPLSDAVLAQAIARTLELGAAVIGVDKFRDIPVAPGSEALAGVLQKNRNVIWGYQFGGHGKRRIPSPPGLPAERTGFVDIVLDPGGVPRRGLLYLDDGGAPHSSFSLMLALAWLERHRIAPRADPANPALLRLGRATIAPLEENDGGYVGADAAGYQLLLDYQGAPGAFARVTLGELLDGKADAALVRERIAIVGSSAHSLKDYFQTPFSGRGVEELTGAELHAFQVSQLLRLALGESHPVRTLPDALEIAALAACCLFGLGAWRVQHGATLAAFFAAGLGLLAAAWYLSAARGLWLPVVPLALGFVLTGFVSAGLRALHEARERAALMSIFSRHVAPEVARELWQRREELRGGGTLRPQRLHVTVLFADLHGYTPVAERLAPEETAQWLNDFLRPMAVIIMAQRGVIRQYSGDAVMAVFGAPLPSETHEAHRRDARDAFACALEMRAKFADLNEAWRAQGRPTAGLRIGLHTGTAVGCIIGSRRREEYALVGDAVNLAARLQSMALPGGDEGESGRILLSAETRALLPADAACESVGSFQVKGRQAPVEVYRAI